MHYIRYVHINLKPESTATVDSRGSPNRNPNICELKLKLGFIGYPQFFGNVTPNDSQEGKN